jgi:prepilin-type processing-associated H-X9-DG protein
MNKPVYRMTHIDNLGKILDSGKICTPNHPEADPNYKGIGLNDLIKKRSLKRVPLGNGGTFLDYVAFYFGARSPMLLKIKDGNGVPQVPQSNIIYLISDTDTIQAHNCNFVFFDGHASKSISRPFTDLADLSHLDWNAVNARVWFDDPNSDVDFDRQRKKQAEFLVLNEVPLSCVIKIATFDETSCEAVRVLLEANEVTIPVEIDKSLYYS